MSEVFLFPGQGSEGPAMGGEALRHRGPVRALVDRASDALGLDLASVLTRGDPRLARTEVGQPALVAVSLGLALEAEARGVHPAAVAGHSVGEVAAFAFAGCLEPEEAIDCAVERARLMAAAARQRPGTMAALLVPSELEVQAALELGARAGNVELAAHNGPCEWVLTGDRAALGSIAASFPTVSLPVSGPWHSRAMAEAALAWRETLRRLEWRRPRLPLVANATGRVVADEADPVELLVGQLTGPVRWAETMTTLTAFATKWRVCGPGRVLRGLLRANLGEAAPVLLEDGSGEEARA